MRIGGKYLVALAVRENPNKKDIYHGMATINGKQLSLLCVGPNLTGIGPGQPGEMMLIPYEPTARALMSAWRVTWIASGDVRVLGENAAVA